MSSCIEVGVRGRDKWRFATKEHVVRHVSMNGMRGIQMLPVRPVSPLVVIKYVQYCLCNQTNYNLVSVTTIVVHTQWGVYEPLDQPTQVWPPPHNRSSQEVWPPPQDQSSRAQHYMILPWAPTYPGTLYGELQQWVLTHIYVVIVQLSYVLHQDEGNNDSSPTALTLSIAGVVLTVVAVAISITAVVMVAIKRKKRSVR